MVDGCGRTAERVVVGADPYIEFHTPLPPPLGEVAERSEVGGGVPAKTGSVTNRHPHCGSSGPNGLIQPPANQDEWAPGPARYAEREPATGRAVPNGPI